jgi:chromosome segregation ATPase
MENYRSSQTQLQERLHEQIGHKDEQISELTLELNRKNQQLAAAQLDQEQLRFRIKEHGDEIASLKEQKRGLVLMIETHEKSEESLRKEL